MAPSRLIQELFKTNATIPIIALIRSPNVEEIFYQMLGWGFLGILSRSSLLPMN